MSNLKRATYRLILFLLISAAMLTVAKIAAGASSDNFSITCSIIAAPNTTTTVTTIMVATTTPASLMVEQSSGKMINVDVSLGSFNEDVTVTLSTKNLIIPAVDRPVIAKVAEIGLTINAESMANNGQLQPSKVIKVTIYYSDADAFGWDESKFVIGRYDPVNKRWAILKSFAEPDLNKVEAYSTYSGLFALLRLVPLADLTLAKAYPNPFTPAAGSEMIFEALTANAAITIYNVAGEKLKELTDDNSDGRISWNGTNDAGNTLGSGVYFAVIRNGSEKKILKIAMQR